jgi:hypothetical protein
MNPCTKCKGKCCRDIFISKREKFNLPNSKEIEDFNGSFVIRGQCPFKSESGCTIDYDKRPLDCKIYPYFFKTDFKGNFEFELNDVCPYKEKFQTQDIEYQNKENVCDIMIFGIWDETDYENYWKFKY